MALQDPIVHWYHKQLCDVGQTCTELTVCQNFIWDGLSATVLKTCSVCHTCQLPKQRKDNYRNLPAKEAKVKPWEKLCVNLIGLYSLKQPNNQTEMLHALTMIDPATGWFNMTAIKTKSADVIVNKIEQTWLSKYPWPK